MILYAILGFTILVFFHEFGHFIMARIFGIKVEEFAIGMGSPILTKKYKGTIYKINIFPIGGYCKLKGQDDFSSKIESFDENSFYGRPPLQRILVAFGGPLFSYLLGFLLLTAIFYYKGDTQTLYTKVSVMPNSLLKDGDEIISINQKKINTWQELRLELTSMAKENIKITVKRNGSIVNIDNFVYDINKDIITKYKKSIPIVLSTLKDNPAEKAGILPYSRITSINNMIPTDEAKLVYAINYLPLPLKVKCEIPKNIIGVITLDIMDIIYKDKINEREKLYPLIKQVVDYKELKIVPDTDNDKKIIGIYYYFRDFDKEKYIKKIEYTFIESIDKSFSQSFNVISLSLKGVFKIFRGELDAKSNVSGPIKIFKQLGEAGSSGGIFVFLNFTAIISLALAFFNLIPFPALDGGHIFINLFELITRRKPNPKIIGVIQIVGIFILISLLFLVSINDIFGL